MKFIPHRTVEIPHQTCLIHPIFFPSPSIEFDIYHPMPHAIPHEDRVFPAAFERLDICPRRLHPTMHLTLRNPTHPLHPIPPSACKNRPVQRLIGVTAAYEVYGDLYTVFVFVLGATLSISDVRDRMGDVAQNDSHLFPRKYCSTSGY